MTHPSSRLAAGLLAGALAAAIAPAATASAAGPPAAAATAKRIVAITPFTAETLADLGVRPIAIGETPDGGEELYKDLKGVKVLTLSHPDGPNLEQVAELDPQLVLSAPEWEKGNEAMRKLGIKVVDADPQSVAAAPGEIEEIGKLVGRTSQADALATTDSKAIVAAERAVKYHPTVMLILGVGRVPYAFLSNSWGGDVVTRAGGRLITGGLKASGGFAQISDEVIVKRDPEVIIAVPHGNPGDIPKITEYLRKSTAWSSTKAAKYHHIYVVSDNSLLQAEGDVASTIVHVEKAYLHDR